MRKIIVLNLHSIFYSAFGGQKKIEMFSFDSHCLFFFRLLLFFSGLFLCCFFLLFLLSFFGLFFLLLLQLCFRFLLLFLDFAAYVFQFFERLFIQSFQFII